MEKKILTEAEQEQTAGGEIVIHNEGTGSTTREICPKCQSRNVEFANEKLNSDYHLVRDGLFHLEVSDACDFYGYEDYRYVMTCRDCGYTGYAKTFKHVRIRNRGGIPLDE